MFVFLYNLASDSFPSGRGLPFLYRFEHLQEPEVNKQIDDNNVWHLLEGGCTRQFRAFGSFLVDPTAQALPEGCAARGSDL